MAKDKLSVTYAQLEAASNKVESKANDYRAAYTRLYGRVDSLSTGMAGDDHKAFVEQINGFKDDFQRMEQLMHEYAEYLKKAAITLRETEERLAAEARNLPTGA